MVTQGLIQVRPQVEHVLVAVARLICHVSPVKSEHHPGIQILPAEKTATPAHFPHGRVLVVCTYRPAASKFRQLLLNTLTADGAGKKVATQHGRSKCQAAVPSA